VHLFHGILHEAIKRIINVAREIDLEPDPSGATGARTLPKGWCGGLEMNESQCHQTQRELSHDNWECGMDELLNEASEGGNVLTL
jgi:hypothetical protein